MAKWCPFLHTSDPFVPVGLAMRLQLSAVNSLSWMEAGGTGMHFSQCSAELAPNPLRQQHHLACRHRHKREENQVLTISSPDSFQTPLRRFMSHFVCTSLNALGVSAPAFHIHTPSLVQTNPVLQASHRESSCGRLILQGLNHKHHAENKGLHKAIYTAVIVQWTFSLRVTRRGFVFPDKSYQNQFEASYYCLAFWIYTFHPLLKIERLKCVSSIGLFSGWKSDI